MTPAITEHRAYARYTTGTYDEIEQLFRSGKSSTEISMQLGIGRSTVNNVLRSRGIRQRKWSSTAPIIKPEDTQGLVRAYQGGKTLSELSVMYGCSRATVRDHLIKAKVYKDSDQRAKPLSDKKKSDICRYYRLGWTIPKIAETVGAKEGTVSSYISKQGIANRNAARKDPNWLPGAPLRLDGTPDIRKIEPVADKIEEAVSMESYPATASTADYIPPKNRSTQQFKISRLITIEGSCYSYELSGESVSLTPDGRDDTILFSREYFIQIAREFASVADMMEAGEV